MRKKGVLLWRLVFKETHMRQFPEDDDDRQDVERSRIEPWMLECLKLNPVYVHWGPYEDCMWKPGANEPDEAPPKNPITAMFTPKKGHGWDTRVITERWSDRVFGLNDLNEVVNFYFYAERDSKPCESCDGDGMNPETHAIGEDFYAFDRPRGEGWADKITQDEVQALWDGGRLFDFRRRDRDRVPTAAEVNAAERRGGLGSHDGINRWILIEARAKRLGVYGKCAQCEGHGSVFVAEHARLGLVLWVLHPRKGCSRGVDIKNITQAELPEVFAYLAEAAQRNAGRFKGVTSQVVGV
jgi:hypothetical protein